MADELLELGSPRKMTRPFLSTRSEVPNPAGVEVEQLLNETLDLIAEMVGTTREFFLRGGDAAYKSFRCLITEVPALGALAARMVVLSNMMPLLPGYDPEGLVGLAENFRTIVSETFSPGEGAAMLEEATKAIS